MFDNLDTSEETTKDNNLWLLLWIIGAIVIISIIFAISYFSNNSDNSALKVQTSLFTKEKQALEKEISDLKTRLIMLEEESKINQYALEQARQTMLVLEKQIYQQQQDIASYKAVLTKQQNATYLVLKDFIIQPTEQSLTYNYKLVMTHVGEEDQFIEGTLQLSLIGQDKEGKQLALPWTKVSIDPNYQTKIPFSFQHIQIIPDNNRYAELTLPAHFTPQFIKVSAILSKQNQKIEKEFKWPAQYSTINTQE